MRKRRGTEGENPLMGFVKKIKDGIEPSVSVAVSEFMSESG